MSAPLAADRWACPVVTCTNTVPAGQVMCVACWSVLPEYVRRSVQTSATNAGRRPTAHTKQVRDATWRSAIRVAASLRS